MSPVHLDVATAKEAPELLTMMADFNALEQISWERAAAMGPLQTLLADPRLGLVGRLFEGERLLGYCVVTWGFDLEWNGRDAFLTELYFRPEARGRGFGRPALAAIETFARGHGAGALHLMVRPENTVALRLYEHAGFVSPPRLFLSKRLA